MLNFYILGAKKAKIKNEKAVELCGLRGKNLRFCLPIPAGNAIIKK